MNVYLIDVEKRFLRFLLLVMFLRFLTFFFYFANVFIIIFLHFFV